MKKIISLLILILMVLSGCAENGSHYSTSSASEVPQKKTSEEYEKILNVAETITVKENHLSFGKDYEIYVNDEQVAEVKGKFLNSFGDEFVMTDMNDKFMIKEEQIKRWGMKYTRTAVIKDADEQVVGHIAEKTDTKLFSIGYYFHFLDKNKKQLGVSDQINFSAFKKNNFFDNNGNVDYFVKEKFGVFSDTYELEVKDKKDIPLLHAILMVCIEDAIKDSEEDDE